MDALQAAYASDEEPPTKRRKLLQPETQNLNTTFKNQIPKVPKQTVPGRYISRRERTSGPSQDSKLLNERRNEIWWEGPGSMLDLPSRISEAKQTNELPECRVPSHRTTRLVGHSAGVNRLQWSNQSGQLLASCSMDHTVAIWDIFRTGKCVARFSEHTGCVKDIQWSDDNHRLLSCGFDKTVKLTDIESGASIDTFKHKEFITSIKFHPWQQSLFLAGGYKSGVVCWDVRSHSVVTEFKGLFGQVQSLEFINKGKQFVSCTDITKRNSTDKAIMVWDFDSAVILSNQVYQEAYPCTCVKVHPQSSHFLAQSNGGYIAIFSCNKPYKLNKRKRYEGHQVSGYHIGFDISPDGSLVGTGSATGEIFFYNYYSSKIIKKFGAHSRVCMDLQFHPVLGSTVASCSWDGGICLWE
eukprot:TRINITY_DN8486_c0_g1_i2.p1 TRINITY_DN8486_c0_g1~~TRINITY_DN8486_c0_g1_i2.p1  ORF type:complete len:411 (-),score=66.71 TRINITY_DN8486_c0_g1_i2:103-1335(-)